ncbi:UNC-like C-terminal-domain-containing protein [Chlamydoabsidia padenii]|nr:UNC-like C-terminal-domain-containing protein [Chlamydoabsidia padenii]
MIRGWIDTAIQHYHQGLLGPPDYALSTRGAMIIHSLTSPTFSEQGQEPRWTRWYTQLTRPTISPMVALAPGTGQCWPMKGNHGSLGIRLSEPIAIQSITLEFPNRSMPSAPKQLEIWGIKDLVKDYSHWMEDDTNSIFLGSFIYNIHSSSRQTFTLDTNRYILFQGVVVRVLSNWGNEHYTCLYRVRVHGITAM